MDGKWKTLLLSALLFCAYAAAQEDTTTTTTEPPSTTTTTEPSTTTITTTIKPTTPTTTTTTTTTKAPDTTTTTTLRPTVPTVPTSTSTPAPKPFPSNEGKWGVEDSNNQSCIVLKGAFEISVAYIDQNNQSRIGNVDVPTNAMANGSCDGRLQYIKLFWDTTITSKNINKVVVNQLILSFEANTSSSVLSSGNEITNGKFALQNVTGVIFKDDDAFPNATDREMIKISILNKAAFQTPLNHSYSCLAQEVLKSDDGNITVKFNDIRFEAFRKTGFQEFSSSIDCPADDSSDIVPIAVGAALAGLVVIVLLAYLIGRRRSRARGYQSV